jgi:hypothetical protein
MTRLTAEAIDQALTEGTRAPASSPRSSAPSPVQHVSASLGVSDEVALQMAKHYGLIDPDGMLLCGRCRHVTDWHVSLHCAPCRPRALAEGRERDRAERERLRAERDAQLRAGQGERVAGQTWGRERRFRDE